jgi:CRISPR/Cas system CMR subunit Cmr4 (Cas7 group RAMP superfamily)
MLTLLTGLLAETFVHVGGGSSEGVVDLPVA